MLKIGKVLKSNGTDGGLLIGLLDIVAEDLNTEEPVFILFDGLPVPFFIQSLSRKGSSRVIVTLNDVNCLRDAEEMVGRDVFLEGEWEEESSEDFTGWTVFDGETLVGGVTGMEPIPGNLCLYVDCSGKEVMIPLHEDFILSADSSERRLVLELPEGLY